MRTLEQRLNRMEKEALRLRKESVWYRRATLVLGLMIIAGVTMGQIRKPLITKMGVKDSDVGIVDVIRAKGLEIYHPQSGKLAAKMVFPPHQEQVQFSLYRKGKESVRLGAGQTGNGFLSLYDNGNKFVDLIAGPTSSLTLRNHRNLTTTLQSLSSEVRALNVNNAIRVLEKNCSCR